MALNARNTSQRPIRHVVKYILKYNERYNLEIKANQTHQLDKWLENKDIDKVLSNDFWKNLTIAHKQETYLVRFQTRQYMGHAWKQLFFGREAYPSKHALSATH